MADNLLTPEELKIRVFEYLRTNPQTQFENIVQFGIEQKIGRSLKAPESQRLLELIHELTVSNILMPAMNRSNTGWPWLAVTSHGREVLGASGPAVYDYEGYLGGLRAQIKNLDEIVEIYISESLRAYQANLYHASMVMLALASERAITLLIEQYVNAIEDDKNRDKLQSRISRRDISEAYERFKESFDSTRSSLGQAELARDYDLHVDSVFTFVRLIRNSIVHPKDMPRATSVIVYSSLQQFSFYSVTIFALIDHYKQNKVTV